jgi:hypothetical protein
MNREALLKVAEAALLDLAGDGFSFVDLRFHRQDGGRQFFGVNLHAGNACRSGNADTLDEAIGIALGKEPFIYLKDEAA